MVCMNRSPDNCDLLRQYAPFRHEIAIHNGFSLKVDRVFIPYALRNKYVKLAHYSHQGILNRA
jgi:hypothetical protein